ncbi:hypothetical protein [Kluyvera ascorbata]|uniref:hypothetical protein n=1 Tax=Kluyvera ascorbata TaxID=51288 RepID=UPI0034D53538
MNIEALKKALKPQLHKIEISGFELYIHRPSIKDSPHCEMLDGLLIHCVKDENGESIFSDGTVPNTISTKDIDQVFANEIYMKIIALFTVEDAVDEVEKK